MPERLIEMRIPAINNRIAMIRPAVRRAAEYCGFEEADTNDIVLAVAEACQNIIVHAYGSEHNGDIVIEIDNDGQDMKICLLDTAPVVDRAKIAPRNLDDVRPGGLGTHFLTTIMDHVEILPMQAESGNILRMSKRVGGTG